MSGKFKWFVILSIFVTLLLIFCPSPQIANAAPKKAVSPEQYITLPAASFVPGTKDIIYYRSSNYIQSEQSYGVFYAPVVLPAGATIKKINVFYVDYDSFGYVQVDLMKVKLATGSTVSLGYVFSGVSENSPNVQKMTMYLNKTTNLYNAYTLYVHMDYLCRIYGVRVIYTLP